MYMYAGQIKSCPCESVSVYACRTGTDRQTDGRTHTDARLLHYAYLYGRGHCFDLLWIFVHQVLAYNKPTINRTSGVWA